MPLLESIARATDKLLAAAGVFCHLVSITSFTAITEREPLRTFLESGPSLFCSCCGERWHLLSTGRCPNGCPWVFATFRAPAWAARGDVLEQVQEAHAELGAAEERRHQGAN
jgi:hypothetical protein